MTQIEDHVTMLTEGDTETKVLGVCWEPVADIITFRITELETPKFARRTLVSITAGIFDPLGWVVKTKIVLKRIILRGEDWDAEITEEVKEWWNTWMTTA